MEELWKVFDFLLSEYGFSVLACVLLVAIIFLGVLAEYTDPRRVEARLRRKRGRETMDARRAYLYRHLADVITDGLENSVFEGKISRKESQELYSWMGKQLGIKDFYPIYHIRNMLKEEISRRLDNNTLYYDRNHDRRKIIFPDTPGWEVKFQCHKH